MYLFGGYKLDWRTGYSPATDTILVYDTVFNKWTSPVHRLPFAAVDMGIALLTERRACVFACVCVYVFVCTNLSGLNRNCLPLLWSLQGQ